MHTPLISIITPNFNCEKFISNTIQSVINQTYEHWELIIVDDCSTDNSISIIELYVNKDHRIKLIKLTENLGPATTRNTGIINAKGRYIAFLDSDDYWAVDKLNVQLNYMMQHNIALSFTGYHIVDEQNNLLQELQVKPIVHYKNLLTNNYLGCLTVMYDTQLIGKVYFPEIKKRQDWALWLLITRNGIHAYGINKTLAFYTKRKSSISSNKINLLKYNWLVYRKFEKLSIMQSLKLLTILLIKKIVK